MKVQVHAREGGAVRAELVCTDEGDRMLRSYFDGGLKALPRHEPLDHTTLEPGREAILESSKACTMMLLARLANSNQRATLEVVAESRGERDSIVDGCPAQEASAR